MNALANKITQGWQDHGAVVANRNALVAKAIDDFNATATSSEPFADGAKVYPEPPAGIKQGGFDWLQWNASLQGPDAHARVKTIADKAKAEGRDTPNIYEMLEMGSMIPGQMLQGAISAAASGLTLPGDVAAGRQQVMDPTTGNVDVGAIGRALDLTGVMSSGSFAGAPKGALGSGPVRAPYPKDTFTQPTPFEYAKGSKYRDAVDAVSDTVANYYGKTEVVDPKTLSTRDRTLNPQIVQEYVADPARTPDVAPGRSGSDAMAVRYGGKTVIVDGNHRAAAALASDRPLEMRVVDMDKAYADAASVKAPEQGILGAMFDYIDANPKGGLESGSATSKYTVEYHAPRKDWIVFDEAGKEFSYSKTEKGALATKAAAEGPNKPWVNTEELPTVVSALDAANKQTPAPKGWSQDIFYHGSPQPFAKFDTSRARIADDALFFTDNPSTAGAWSRMSSSSGGVVFPVRLKMDNPYVYDWYGEGFDEHLMQDVLAKARAAGHDSVVIKNIQDRNPNKDIYEPMDASTQYVVFHPDSVKSVFEAGDVGAQLNAGDKSLAPLLAADFSHAARVVEGLPTVKAPASQWLATLKNKGVKDEELDALNLPTGGQVLTKAEIQAKIAEGTPKIEEIVKGGKTGHPQYTQADIDQLEAQARRTDNWTQFEAAQSEYEAQQLGYGTAAARGEAPGTNITDEEVGEFIRDQGDDPADYSPEELDATRRHMQDNAGAVAGPKETKYSQYQLPGGENYREILVTMPGKEGLSASEQYEYSRLQSRVANAADGLGPAVSVGDQARFRELANRDSAASADANKYRSSHWDEPNVLGHMRVNDRNVDGLKTLHAEELQSDWHQEGKKKGYKSEPKPLDTTVTATNKTWSAGERSGQTVYRVQKGPEIREIAASSPEEAKAIFEHLYNTPNEQGGYAHAEGVPDAPFKKSWPDLLLKRLAKRAVDEGYDAISWTDGATQAERYDLSKQIKELRYTRKDDGTYTLGANNNPESWTEIHIGDNIPADKLADYVGKDVADKITADKGRDGSEAGGKVLSGVDLKVGGEGMKAFYDAELPRRAKKLLGTAVEKKPLSGNKLSTRVVEEGDGNFAVLASDGKRYAGFGSPSAAQDYIDKNWETFGKGFPSVHFVRLTPEVKARVAKGFPLYSTGVPLISDDGKHRLVPVTEDPFAK